MVTEVETSKILVLASVVNDFFCVLCPPPKILEGKVGKKFMFLYCKMKIVTLLPDTCFSGILGTSPPKHFPVVSAFNTDCDIGVYLLA